MRNLRGSVAAASAVGALALIALLAAAVGAQDDGWIVSSSTRVDARTLTVHGELRVLSGATLTLNQAVVTIEPGDSVAPALVVEEGGRLVMVNSTVQSVGTEPGQRVAVVLRGAAEIRNSLFQGLAPDLSRPMGPSLAGGMRTAWGGLVILSSDVTLDHSIVEDSQGCGVSVVGASPTLQSLVISRVAFVEDGQVALAAGLCIRGGAATVDGLVLADIGDGGTTAGTPTYLAGIVAAEVDGLLLRNLDETAPFADDAGAAPALSAALVLQNPSHALVEYATLKNVGAGILMVTDQSPPGETTVTFSHVSVQSTAGPPISVVGTYSAPTSLNWNNCTITDAPGDGLFFQSDASTAPVTATVDNVTVANSGHIGINLTAVSGTNTHTFAVWNSNSSFNRAEGIYLNGTNLGLAFHLQLYFNGVYMNNLSGIRTGATYAAGLAKLSSARAEFNIADNNSLVSPSDNGAGIYFDLGRPSTMNLRYLNNTARGNGDPTGTATYYGHYVDVKVTNSMAISGGWISGIRASDNLGVGLALIGGAGTSSRFDAGRLRESNITGQRVGIHVSDGRLEIWNSTMANTLEFEGDATDFIILGSEHKRLSGTTTGNHRIRSCKLIDIHAVWQNMLPATGMPISFEARNNTEGLVYSDCATEPLAQVATMSTSSTGNWTGWILDWVYDPTLPAGQNQRKDYAPLTIRLTQLGNPARSESYTLQTNILGTVVFTDPDPPTIIISNPREGGTYTTANLTVFGNVSDELSGTAAFELSMDGTNWIRIRNSSGPFSYTFRDLVDGVYSIWLHAWDRANEGIDPRSESLVVLRQVAIDTMPPSITMVLPPVADGAQLYTNQEQIIFQGAVDASVVRLFLNGVRVNLTGTAFNIFASLSTEGPQAFLFLAMDAAGNTRNLTITVIRDTAAPTLVVTSPSESGDIYLRARTITIDGLTDANAYVQLNGVNASLVGTAFRVTASLNEGVNSLVLRAYDAAGNTASRTLTVWADTAAPVLTISSITDGDYLKQSKVDLVGHVSEHIDYVTVNLRIFPVSASNDWQATMGLDEGVNTLTIEGRDRAGNVGRLVLTIHSDTVAPVITLTGLPDKAAVRSGLLTVEGTVSETADLTIDGLAHDLTGLSFSESVQLKEGINVIEVTATDRAGNSASLTREIRLDTGAPSIDILEPFASATVSTTLVKIVGSTEPNATVRVGAQLVTVDSTGHFVAYVHLDTTAMNTFFINVTDQAGNSATKTIAVNYEAPVADSSSATLGWLGAAAAVAAGLAIGGRFIAKRRVDGEVEEALRRQAEANQGVPGYAEPAMAPPPAHEGPAPRAPRPPRPPSP
jgi:hypothetical protein